MSLGEDLKDVLDYCQANGVPVVPALRGWVCTRCSLRDSNHDCQDRACVCCYGVPPCPSCGSHDLCEHDRDSE